MKKLSLLIVLVLSMSCAYAQQSKRKVMRQYNSMEVLTCKIGNTVISKGDTLTIGMPFINGEKFAFINRRVEWYDRFADYHIEKIFIDWANRKVIVNNLYRNNDGLNDICYAEYVISPYSNAWITLDNAIRFKEVVKLNSKDLKVEEVFGAK